jgi:hypothetical protein
MGVVVFILLAVVIGAIAWFAYRAKQKRREDLFTFANQYKLTYSRVDPYGMVGFPFHLFSLGEGRGCENIMTGEWQGMPVKEADYWYYTQSTDSKGHTTKSYSYFSVVVADLTVEIPAISIQKESLFTKLADHLGFHDIDFESEDFNRKFQVKAKDKEFAFKLIDARMIEWLLGTGGAFGFEANGPWLLVYCKRRKPMELVPLFGTAKQFSDHVPSLVLNEFGRNKGTSQEGSTS